MIVCVYRNVFVLGTIAEHDQRQEDDATILQLANSSGLGTSMVCLYQPTI